MRRSISLLAACLVSFGLAAPLDQDSKLGDVDILNYALTLEFLESKFYSEGLSNFTEANFLDAGFSKEFYKNLKGISQDEKDHVAFLSTALGDKAIKEPSFAFPVKDAASFVGLSSVLEGVGVSAYLGAAPAITNKDYLTAAGSILTVEARHASYIRAALKQKPFPAAFDTPLGFNQVFSLAAQFVTGFAEGTKVPFKPFPKLTAVPSSGDKFCAGKGSVTFKDAQGENKPDKVYAVFYSGLETYYVQVTNSGDKDYTASIPGPDFATKGQSAPKGQTYVVLSTADGKDTKANDENIIAGVGILEIGC
ncbi:ferritin-like domain-containing protein [Hirsutella rhossiliensis]|uniref:Ferritin-like domain-containing protein n=1 Tax=Hirsutella rhossiliensis TaxID=111463 RepID=A0A9P8SJU8_9HYPO|nr:ferritin-like domain-containing protein [Hirsutella rhossiliensis]KAH0963426.1 ferritin-like domain-containing protein [Hirsutella rhossiliensis]